MAVLRTLVTRLVLEADKAFKGLKAYDKLWSVTAKSVEASASLIEKAADRAGAAMARMSSGAAAVRSGVGAARAGGGGGGGGSRSSRDPAEDALRRARQDVREQERAQRQADAQRRSIERTEAAKARRSGAHERRETQVAGRMAGLAAGAAPVNEATAALGRFASASDRAKARVEDLTSQVARNRREMADLKEQALRTGDADGTLAGKMQGLAVATGKAQVELAGARRELRKVDGGLIDSIKNAANLSGRFDALKVAAGNLISSGISRVVSGITDGLVGSAKAAMDFEKASVQFGARLENNRYNPTETQQRGLLPSRSFTGLSAAVGIRIPTWTGGAFVTNYSHSYRAPSLEELYNNGPHPGNLAFEIGQPNLSRELGDGLDFGVRHSSKRLRLEANGFFYRIKEFVFLAPTGDVEDDLIVAEYRQGTTRYGGAEARLDVELHPAVWLNLGADYVNAELTDTNTPLPRIPPLRGRAGVELRYKNLLVNPEVVMAHDQDRLFPTETRTAGYTVFGVSGSYLIAQQHAAHIISFNVFNLGDRLYRNHLSFIKGFAPEMGRGLRVTYTLRFF